ncbi:MAG: sterol desaturase family protein [Candidatus Omnitrophica bacterium]|nr:sterol desaturase family protein [Candidatus Omnitrophota bacterium]
MKYSIPLTFFVLVTIFLLEGIFPHFSSRKHRIAHGLKNITLGVAAGIIATGIGSLIFFYAKQLFGTHSPALIDKIRLSPGIEFAAGFLLFDLWMYTWHRMNHRIHLLWRFHRVHHTDTDMDATTAIRFHPGEIFFSHIANFFILFLIGIASRPLGWYLMFFQTNILFHHSNLAIPEKYDRILRTIIVTPNMHRVHHSIIREETDSNYSSLFSFWDRLFNTFRRRDDTHLIRLGIPQIALKERLGFKRLLTLPFKNFSRVK